MKVDYNEIYKKFYENEVTDENKTLLSSIHNVLCQKNFVWKFKTGLRYFLKGKKEFLIFYQNRDGSVRLKIRLENIESYEQEINKCSDKIQNCIYNQKECNYCGDCSTQIHLDYKGKDMNICNPTWWWTFCYFDKLENLLNDDIESLLDLIKHELPFYVK